MIDEYDVLRVITTLLVVIGHGKYYKIITPYGGCDYSGFVEAELICWKLIAGFTSFIYAFHMPLFMALGGALFYGSYQKGRFPKAMRLAKNKALRLLVPFAVAGLCFSFPIKFATGYFTQSDSIVKDYMIGQLFVQGNTHLWYLLAMFFVFLLVYYLERYVPLNKSIKLIVLLGISVISRCVSVKLIRYVLYYAFWFYVGFCFERYREKVNTQITVSRMMLLGLVSVSLFAVERSIGGRDNLFIKLFAIGCDILLTFSSCITTYMLAYLLSKMCLIRQKWYKVLSADTFGIYLYSDPINYVILYAAAAVSPYALFATNAGAVMLYIFRIVATLLVSIGITEILRALKVKYLF